MEINLNAIKTGAIVGVAFGLVAGACGILKARVYNRAFIDDAIKAEAKPVTQEAELA